MNPATPSNSNPAPVILREQDIDGETILFLGEVTLVCSKSEIGAWYVIQDGRCSCPGFTYRGSCRHTGPAELAAELDRVNAVAVEAVGTPPQMYPSTCPPTKEPWLPEPEIQPIASYFRKVAGAYLNGGA